jgi:hypothetical protein
MFIYSFLHAKQSRLFAEIDEHSNKVMDLLRQRSYMPFKAQSAFPSNLHADRVGKTVPPPAPTTKVS